MLYRSIRRIALMAIVAAYGLWATPSQSQQDQSYIEIGKGLSRVHSSMTTLTRRLDLTPRVVHGAFHPEVAWDCVTPSQATARYSVNLAEAYKIGDGESFGADTVLEVALHPSNPLGIDQSKVTLRPSGGAKDNCIYTDVMLVGSSPERLAWKWFQEKHRELFGSAPPTAGCTAPNLCHPPCPTCEVCPVCPTPPPPAPACAPMPQFVRRTIDKASRFTSKRAWGAVQAWAATCPQ